MATSALLGLALLTAPAPATGQHGGAPAPTGTAGTTGAAGPTFGAGAASTLGGPGYDLPLPGATVVALFRAPVARWSAGHRGIDLAAAPGHRVLAPADGAVVFQGFVVDRRVVVLEHRDGRRSSLEPVSGTLPDGAAVTRGEVVGVVEDRVGHCRQACVHWGVRQGESYIDPLRLLGQERAVLLPTLP